MNIIRQMTKDFMTWDREDATKLYGVASMVPDSYELFYKKRIENAICDLVHKDILEKNLMKILLTGLGDF